MTQATNCIVDGANGIFCWKFLAQSYPLFREDGTPLTPEEIEGLKGEDWCEWVDHLGDVYVKNDDGSLWLVYQDSDIFAVNPKAEWSDVDEWYVMPEDMVSRGFSAGNYASAYETTDLETAMANISEDSEHYRAAFTLGFYASFELHEIPGSDIEAFQTAYFSEGGQMAVKNGYVDPRPQEEWEALV